MKRENIWGEGLIWMKETVCVIKSNRIQNWIRQHLISKGPVPPDRELLDREDLWAVIAWVIHSLHAFKVL